MKIQLNFFDKFIQKLFWIFFESRIYHDISIIIIALSYISNAPLKFQLILALSFLNIIISSLTTSYTLIFHYFYWKFWMFIFCELGYFGISTLGFFDALFLFHITIKSCLLITVFFLQKSVLIIYSKISN